jgi:hypothetical protein
MVMICPTVEKQPAGVISVTHVTACAVRNTGATLAGSQ